MKKLLLVMAVFLLVGNVQATTQFYDGDPADHLWTTVGNWDDGIPDIEDWAKIRCGSNLPGATIVSGVDAIADRVHIGYSEGGAMTVDGGTLTTAWDDDLLLGKQGGTGVLDMISGAINVGRDLEVGAGSPGIVYMTGGTIIIGDDLMIPESSGSIAEVYLDGGTIILDDSYSGGSALTMSATGSMDIKFGTLILAGDEVSRVQGYVDNGWITGFGIVGNVTADITGNTTTVKAIDPLQRTPAYGAVVPTGTVNLSWVNLPPISLPGYSVPTGVWVDVWFGTDPNSLTREVDAAGPGTTTADVSAPSLDEYIWRVDTYRHGDPAVMDYENDPNLVVDQGWTMYFVASDDTAPEVVIDTPPMATWIDEPTLLQVTITDDDKSDVTIVWTSDEDPNAVFDPPTTTYTKGTVTYPLVSTTSLTVDYHSGPFTVTATVSDGNPLLETRSAGVTVDCADNPCQAARGPVALDALHPADLVGDCIHDLADFAVIASNWLREDYKPLDEPVAFTE